MRFMYDSLDWQAIPHDDAQLVAGYVQWPGAWGQGAIDYWRSQGKIFVGIASQAHINDGVVGDCESGDMTPGQTPGWVQMRRAAGVDPTIYVSGSQWGAVRAAFASAGVAEPHYWIAQWDGNSAIPAGAVAKQFQSTNAWDKSSVADFWPGVDSGPAPVPASDDTDTIAAALLT